MMRRWWTMEGTVYELFTVRESLVRRDVQDVLTMTPLDIDINQRNGNQMRGSRRRVSRWTSTDDGPLETDQPHFLVLRFFTQLVSFVSVIDLFVCIHSNLSKLVLRLKIGSIFISGDLMMWKHGKWKKFGCFNSLKYCVWIPFICCGGVRKQGNSLGS